MVIQGLKQKIPEALQCVSRAVIYLAVVYFGFLLVMSSNQALWGCFALHMPCHGKPNTAALVMNHQGLGRGKNRTLLFLYFCT